MSDEAAQARSEIRFLLDGRVHTVSGVAPTTTLLNYLRDHLERTGTKEGCAEGGCGACTVVVGEAVGGRVRFRTVNSCIQLLPTIDGQALITVESLRAAGGDRLHPVQQAVVDAHGSQCGFCTPGVVMSLFGLYKSVADPSREHIDAALAGNLCRCTGYRPIIDAARRMYAYGRALPGDLQNVLTAPCGAGPAADEAAVVAALRAIEPSETVALRDAAGRYFAPVTVEGLAQLLQAFPDATILAGGTDVALWLTKQYRELPLIVYIGNVAALKRVVADAEAIEIGAAVTLTDAFRALIDDYPDLQEIARRFASPPIRNAGTLCGNIANGAPTGDALPVLISLGADVVLRHGEAIRSMALDDFVLGDQGKALRPGEFLQCVRVPRARAHDRVRAYKISKRYDQDISTVCAVFKLRCTGDVVDSIRICYGGLAAIPQRAQRCEQRLQGRVWSEQQVLAAIELLAEDFEPITDLRATRGYRLLVAGNLLRRFYFDTAGAGARLSVFGHVV